ncbi:hypothetical protein LTR56_006047 [Elasticomyces elasticus]|nr:hypothetical protein LTR56_006047 [Elasticomyces elasticus]KAK3668991.1 hypothetical protein LTR22_000070 [Elasticomyces elasticus]KAK4922709.1 hypothetical protein LTR49_010065 [Elasticomyces elasticus]KAK5760964.1 hypothetical protein LTS12_008968 [Elasticomyces elasticus]
MSQEAPKRGPLRVLAGTVSLAAVAWKDPQFGEDNPVTLEVYRKARERTVPWLEDVEKEMRERGVWVEGGSGQTDADKADPRIRLLKAAWACMRSPRQGTRKDVLLQRLHGTISRSVADTDKEIARLEELLEGAVRRGSSGPHPVVSGDARDLLSPSTRLPSDSESRPIPGQASRDINDRDSGAQPTHAPDIAISVQPEANRGLPHSIIDPDQRSRQASAHARSQSSTRPRQRERGRSSNPDQQPRSHPQASQTRPRSQQWRLPIRTGPQGTQHSGIPRTSGSSRRAPTQRDASHGQSSHTTAPATGTGPDVPAIRVSPPSLQGPSTRIGASTRPGSTNQPGRATATAGQPQPVYPPQQPQHVAPRGLEVPHAHSSSHPRAEYGTTPETNSVYAWRPPDNGDADDVASIWSRDTIAPTIAPTIPGEDPYAVTGQNDAAQYPNIVGNY